MNSFVSRRVVASVQRRAMSSGHVDFKRELATAQQWQKIGYGMGALSVSLLIYAFVINPFHPHDLPEMPYANVKKKYFPWGDGRTPLFGKPHKSGNTGDGHHH